MDQNYNFGFLDEHSKRAVRRALLKAVSIPGYQVPFGSRELPIGGDGEPEESKSHCPLSVKRTA